MSRLKKWDRFAHNGVYAHLQAIVSKVKPMGAEIGSSPDSAQIRRQGSCDSI